MLHLLPSLSLLYICLQYALTTTSSIVHADELVLRKSNVRPQRNLQTEIGQIENFRLINADTNLPLFNISDGMIINLATLPTSNLNIEATISNGTVGSVRFGYLRNTNYRTESVAPYSFCGDIQGSGDYYTCTRLVTGQHKVSATPFSGFGATGIVGTTRTISFSITTCNIPQFIDATWENYRPLYPMSIWEPQGLMIGNDIIIFAGFINNFDNVTNRTFARDITIANSPWRRMDDMPLLEGITHAPQVVIGSKVYMCGGYTGGHPGPHTSLCFVYDHSIPPGQQLQWSTFTSLPNGGTAGAGMIYDSIQNALYYTGGGQRLDPNSAHPVDLNNTWKYSFNSPLFGWVPSTPLPYTANHLSYVTHTDTFGVQRHYILGGQIAENEVDQNLGHVYEFMASTETWIQRTSMLLGRSHASASTRAFGCGVITVGGSVNSVTSKRNRTDDISYYDIPSNSWTSIGRASDFIATPVVDIHSSGYMHFVSNRNCVRRRLSS